MRIRFSLQLEVAERATIEDAWAALVALMPQLATSRAYIRFARNGTYTHAAELLAEGDEVSAMPPIAGGSNPT
jgi:molybdopterin converting factor small subunit